MSNLDVIEKTTVRGLETAKVAALQDLFGETTTNKAICKAVHWYEDQYRRRQDAARRVRDLEALRDNYLNALADVDRLEDDLTHARERLNDAIDALIADSQ